MTDTQVSQFWEVRICLSVEDDIILLNDKIFIPVALQKRALWCLHSAHQGVTSVVDLGQVGRWERGTHQPRSGGESRRAVTWSDPSFPNPRTVSTVVESLLIILCLYCIYKCIRRPHNIWRCRTGFLPCARTVLVRCFVYFDNFSEVNFCVLCCSVREHTFGFDSCGVVGPRVSGMWTV